MDIFGQEKFDSPGGQYHLEMSDPRNRRAGPGAGRRSGRIPPLGDPDAERDPLPLLENAAIVEFVQIKERATRSRAGWSTPTS